MHITSFESKHKDTGTQGHKPIGIHVKYSMIKVNSNIMNKYKKWKIIAVENKRRNVIGKKKLLPPLPRDKNLNGFREKADLSQYSMNFN